MTDFRDPRELREEARRLLAVATAIEEGTWSAVVAGRVTPADLAGRLGCSVSSANNRLRALYDLRLIDRELVLVPGGGRQFAYVWTTRREGEG
jgi:predicted transcriptional regulator